MPSMCGTPHRSCIDLGDHRLRPGTAAWERHCTVCAVIGSRDRSASSRRSPRRCSRGIVTLKLTDVSDAQQSGVETCWSPVSWGSLDELFVNLTSPLRIQAFIGSLLPDPRLTHRAKREQRAGSRTTGTRHHESDGSDPHQQGDDDPTGHGSKPTRSAASSAARTLNPRETRYGPWGALPN